MTSAEIRQAFIEFFVKKHGHTFVPSSPVVPLDDPTLLFTNAGMNQFKPIFLGQEKRTYTRAVNTQKCIRAGGKHNDLDDVGRSRRHHTFFEMLGNWSFGDYFKRGAIEMSWELLTKVWGLDPERIHVSCFEGDEKNGVPRDEESADIWHTVCGVPRERIHYFGKDNFWEMGDTGPCGPCTEIYYDRTPDKTGGSQVNGDDPRVMEIWNNVFIQYNRNPDRSLVTLPAQHVDTGMGFERIAQVLQDKQSNYDIDLFDPFWARLRELSGHKYSGLFPKTNATDPAAEAASPGLRKDIAFRVIADHIRCLTFALTDGATPSNEGRGYVLRRILRRAVRFGRQQLELKDPFLYTLVDVVVDSMGDAFPELKRNPGHVKELIKDEEISFGKTLDRGIELFDKAALLAIGRNLATVRGGSLTATTGGQSDERCVEICVDGKYFLVNVQDAAKEITGKAQIASISGEDAFKLYDTFGFPIDLTSIMASERGMTVDLERYEELMEEAREKARAGGKTGDSSLVTLPPGVLEQLRERGVAPTDDSQKYGYEQMRSKVVAIWDGTQLVDSIKTDTEAPAALILDKTNFYAEMGGQVGDTGRIVTAGGGSFDVDTTRVVGGYVLHVGRVIKSEIIVGKAAGVTVGMARVATQQNHTATHLANWALREVLGEGVQQKGSLVDATKLRFDFSHGKSLTEDEIAKVESLTNEQIAKKQDVYCQEAPQERALAINGLRAVFGEKYPPMVRVVSVGPSVDDLIASPDKADWRGYSVEFCGGTHVANTEEIGNFVITSEESVSKGIRRIVALSGEAATSASEVAAKLDAEIARAHKAPEADLPTLITALQRNAAVDNVPLRAKRRVQAAVVELQGKLKAWEKRQKKQDAVAIDAAAAAQTLVEQSGGKAIVAQIENATEDQLRSVLDSIKARQPSFAAMLASGAGEKLTLIASVSDDLIAKGFKAGDWVKEAAKAAGGGGGGRPNHAQGSGKDPSKINDALDRARAVASSI
jgi:alanyl-tRNA synthetase